MIAHQRTTEQIADKIGADRLFYQNLDDVCHAVNLARLPNAPAFERFEDAIFTGDYITGDIDQAYLSSLEAKRNDAMQSKTQDLTSGTGLADL